MGSAKVEKRILKEDGFDKDLEEARTLRDLQRLEKEESKLWRLVIFLIFLLTLAILIAFQAKLNFTPAGILRDLTPFKWSAFIGPGALLVLGLCVYAFWKNQKIRNQRREIFRRRMRMERTISSFEEIGILFQISAGISAHKDLNPTLESITRESLGCLKAHRSTLFLYDEKGGILKTQLTLASDPLYEQVGLFEEKEVARKTLRQKKVFFLREPGDFSEFFKYEDRDRKITSLMSVPLISQSRAVGILSVVIIDSDRRFTEKNLQFFMVFGHLASIAIENSYLLAEVRKGINFRKSYEHYLDNILNQLQSLSEDERRRIEDHIGQLLPADPLEGRDSLSGSEEETPPRLKGMIPLTNEPSLASSKDDRVSRMLRVDREEETLASTHDLGNGGLFIRTPNPLDLGEEFRLKLHLVEGEQPVEITCKVIWTNKYGKESRHLRRGMGVKFLNLAPEIKTRVEDYLRSNKNKEFIFEEDQISLDE